MDSLQLCRLCLSKNGEGKISLFFNYSTALDSSIRYVDIAMSLLANLNITEFDQLPHLICKICANKLQTYYKFQQECEKCDKQLKSLTTNGIKVEPEICIETDEHLQNENVKIELDLIEANASYEFSNDKNEILLHEKNCDIRKPTNVGDVLEINTKTRKVENTKTIKQYICSRCKKSFDQFDVFDQHRKTHKATKFKFHCKICNRKFFTDNNLQIHISKVHDFTFPLRCDCGKVFNVRHEFVRHICSVRTFECFCCHRIIPSFYRLKTHIRSHRRRARCGICDICGNTFANVHYLKVHKKTMHSSTKLPSNFICYYCNRHFFKKSTLQSHMLFHRPETPFACEVCGKGFHQQSHVRAHAVIHSDVRNHKCTLCSKSYRRAADLTNHMQTHYQNYSYKCSLCVKSYFARTRVARHLRNSHNEGYHLCRIM